MVFPPTVQILESTSSATKRKDNNTNNNSIRSRSVSEGLSTILLNNVPAEPQSGRNTKRRKYGWGVNMQRGMDIDEMGIAFVAQYVF